MYTTQGHVPILDIRDNIVFLKDGSATVVLKTNAVNFGLLSEREQVAIIDSFAQFLNSLAFSVQIIIHSKRLDIGSYLLLLDNAQKTQTNPLLFQMMTNYRRFIQTTVKENDVLDKRFYIAITASYLELGFGLSSAALATDMKERMRKTMNVLHPRRDQIIRLLVGSGLKASQLDNEGLIKLFYEIYNPKVEGSETMKVAEVNLAQPKIVQDTPSRTTPAPPNPFPQQQPAYTPTQSALDQSQMMMAQQRMPRQETVLGKQSVSYPPLQPQPRPQPTQTNPSYQPSRVNKDHPFVTEELTDSV